MVSAKTPILVCLLLLLLPCSATAAGYKGFLLLKDFSQFFVVDYGFNGQQSMPKQGGNNYSLNNNFAESYNAGIEYSLLSDYIVNGHLKISLGMDQQMYSGSSSYASSSAGSGSGSRYSYDLDGLIFKLSPTPAYFSARSETQHLQNPFSKGYDVTTDVYSVGASFKHRILALNIGYSNSTEETSGTSSDTRTQSEQLVLRARNNVKNSKTDVQFFHSSFTMQPLSYNGTVRSSDTSYSVIGNNYLMLTQSGSSLDSTIRYREETSGRVTKDFSIGEGLSLQLGKALTLGIGYEYATNSTSAATDINSSDDKLQGGSVSLSHRLYNSLVTQLKVQGSKSDGSAGTTDLYGGSAGFTYTKKLYEADRLNINYSRGFSVMDRNLTTGVLTAFNEPLTAQLTATSQLQQPYVVEATVIVNDLANPLLRYTENSDYRLVKVGAYTGFDFAIIGSRIADGQKLQVTYSYRVDANENLRTSNHVGSAMITFQEGTYGFNGNFTLSNQTDESGSSALSDSRRSLSYTIGATRNKNNTFANIVYGKNESEELKNMYVEGTYRVTRNFEEATVNAQISDRNTWTEATTYNRTATSQNSFMLNADYSRNIFANALLNVRASYYRFSETGRERDDIAVESSFRWGEGKLLVEATGKVQYRYTDGDNALDEQLNLRITRYF